MQRLALTLILIPLALVLSAAHPRALGPGGVIDAHRQLLSALDRGDAEAAAKFFTRCDSGVGLDAAGKFKDSPGALFFVPGDASSPAVATAALFKGGKTRIVRGWSDCPSADLSWAALELEHTPAGGTATLWHSSALVRHEQQGFRLYYWHLSPATASLPGSTSVTRQ